MRLELQANGTLGRESHTFHTLSHRSDMTGADRSWAARYNPGDVLRYTTGSGEQGIARDSSATVRAVDARTNTLTVELDNGSNLTYDPRRLRGVNAYRETARDFATGDRLQFGAADKSLGVANRDLGTVTAIEEGRITVALDGKAPRTVIFDPEKFRHFDHGYAVTSHSSQGLTAGRVLVNIDTESSRSLVNNRLAYVAVSRASEDARIYTDDAATLGKRLAVDISKTAAVDFRPPAAGREKERAAAAEERRSPRSTEQTQRAVAAFRANSPHDATALLERQGRIHEYAHPGHRLAAVALDYLAKPERAIIVAPSASDREELTRLIRSELQLHGKLAAERCSLPVLVERDLDNPRLAANYAPGDTIRYKTGSPREHGIADHSTATVLSVDAAKNLLTVETRGGETVSYNPALLKRQTGESAVYRSDEREIATGERVRFTATDPEQRIRSGDFATVLGIGEDRGLTVQPDKGGTVEIAPDKARHIEYGYTVASAKNLFADRVLLTGDRAQLAERQAAFARLSPSVREIAIYISDGPQLLQQQRQAANRQELAPQPSNELNSGKLPDVPQPQIEYAGHGIGR